MTAAIPDARTTDEWWSITTADGQEVSLHQHGWNVATVGGSRYDLPPRRGENLRFAYRPGAIHRRKLPDSRTINLIMWVTGVDPATGAAADDALLRWNDSWDFLRRLVWRADGSQFTLTRRWFLTDPATGMRQLVVADGLAEIADTMTPTMTGRFRAEFTMTLLMADPFFYGRSPVTDPAYPRYVVPINRNTPTAVKNPGHDVAAFGDLEVDLIGPLTNPVLTNSITNPDVWTRYGGYIPAGQTATLKVSTFEATNGSANVIGAVSNFGSRHWMGLHPRDNTLTLTSTGGGDTGSAVLRFRPPYV